MATTAKRVLLIDPTDARRDVIEDSQRLAATDPLTGLMNRRAFAAAIGAELARCERHGSPLSFVLLDAGSGEAPALAEGEMALF